MKLTTLNRALTDKRLLGLGGPSWQTWRAVLKAAHAERLTPAERAAFDLVAGGRAPPTRKVRQFAVVVSRRAGKGRAAAALATYASALLDHSAALAPGEKGIVACISPTRAQAQIVSGYTSGYFEASPILRDEVREVTADEIRLQNGNTICTLASDFRTLRGRTLLLAILDEASFLHTGTTAASDIETARALLPGLATTNGMLVILSSPYRRGGLVFELHRDFFGVDSDDVLVVAGPSLLFNPTLDAKMIEAATQTDPEAAASEWHGLFRTDLSQLLDDETVDAAVDRDRPLELPPRADVEYRAFVDAAGGVGGADSYCVAIGHREREHFVVDVVRGSNGRFDPKVVTAEYAALVKSYGIGSVTGDFYAAGWVASAWREHGISYINSESNKSAIYLEVVPLFSRGLARLPDHPKLLGELRLLERHTHRSGRDTVDHGRAGSDDFANACCGALWSLADSVPALWRREALLVSGVPAAIPPRCDMIFAVLVAGQNGTIAVAFFAFNKFLPGVALTLLDVDLVPLAADFFDALTKRLVALSKLCRSRTGIVQLYASAPLADEAQRRGLPCEPIDGLMSASEIASIRMSAAVHIGSGKVKITTDALARAEHFPLGGILDAAMLGDDHDALTLAPLCGIALALDANRTLKAA